jgi:hypothetical protein
MDLPRVTKTEQLDLSKHHKLSIPTEGFGVVYESLDGNTIAAIARDILNITAELPPTKRLVVYSPNATELKAALGVLDVDFSNGMFERCGAWKAYYLTKAPKPPAGVKFDFIQKLGVDKLTKPVFTDRKSYPNIDRVVDRIIPLSQGPNQLKSPPNRAVNPWAPAIQLFSSAQDNLTSAEEYLLGLGTDDGKTN